MKIIYERAGYKSWEDVRKIRKAPAWGCLSAIVIFIFLCGGISTGGAIYLNMRGEEEIIVADVATLEPSATATDGGISAIIPQPGELVVSPTAPPTLTPTPTGTLAPTMTPAPVCGNAHYLDVKDGDFVRVDFEEIGALRLLSEPRQSGDDPRLVQRLLYDNDRLAVLGDPVCGYWRGQSTWYIPIRSTRFNERGWVGMGDDEKLWIRIDDAD